MSDKTIALKERINELKCRRITLDRWRMERAKDIQSLIIQQSVVDDDIMCLEVELARAKSDESRKPFDMVAMANKLLGGFK